MGWDLVKPRYLCGFAGLCYVFNLGYTRFFSPTSKCTIIIHLTVILPPSQNPPRFVISCERPSVCQRGVIAATNAQLDIMNCKSASSSWPSFTNTHLLQQYLLGQSGAIPPEKKPHVITICFGGSYLNLTELKADLLWLKWKILTVWVGVQLCMWVVARVL